MNQQLLTKVKQYLTEYHNLQRDISTNVKLLTSQQKKLQEVKGEQDLAVESAQALKDVRPLLAQSSIARAEELANAAIAAIFDFPAKLHYSEEDARFFIETPNGDADLQSGVGGGLQSVVSFVLQLSLLLKNKSRLFMVFDEMFTQLSDDALTRFLEFVNKLVTDLGLELFLITHDSRITEDQVTHVYQLADGKSFKVK